MLLKIFWLVHFSVHCWKKKNCCCFRKMNLTNCCLMNLCWTNSYCCYLYQMYFLKILLRWYHFRDSYLPWKKSYCCIFFHCCLECLRYGCCHFHKQKGFLCEACCKQVTLHSQLRSLSSTVCCNKDCNNKS